MGKRMFEVMRTENNKYHADYVTLDQYIIYNDKMYNGLEDEKVELNFKMVDLDGDGQVTEKEFIDFWASMIGMYKHLMQIRGTSIMEMEDQIKDIFH